MLVYEDHRIVVPRSYRLTLIQAAQAAAHEGLGDTRSLLKWSFYWPNMPHDARRFTQACQAIQARGITSPGRQKPGHPPRLGPEQVPDTLCRDVAGADAGSKKGTGPERTKTPENDSPPPSTTLAADGQPPPGQKYRLSRCENSRHRLTTYGAK